MNDKWSDFEKYVFQELGKIPGQFSELKAELANLKGRSAAWGAAAGIFGTALCEVVLKTVFHL